MINRLIQTILFILLLNISVANAKEEKYEASFVVKNEVIKLEVADTPYECQKGLMNRDVLSPKTGMVFKFERSVLTDFWMKNVSFPIDILFVQNNKIVKIYNSVPPCKTTRCPLYSSTDYVDSAIELNAGFCHKYGIQEGNSFYVDYMENKN